MESERHLKWKRARETSRRRTKYCEWHIIHFLLLSNRNETKWLFTIFLFRAIIHMLVCSHSLSCLQLEYTRFAHSVSFFLGYYWIYSQRHYSCNYENAFDWLSHCFPFSLFVFNYIVICVSIWLTLNLFYSCTSRWRREWMGARQWAEPKSVWTIILLFKINSSWTHWAQHCTQHSTVYTNFSTYV